MIDITIDEFKKGFEYTIDSVTNMSETDRFKWKSFGHKICDTINVLYYANKNDVKAVQRNLEEMKHACNLIHDKDETYLLIEDFDKKADNYIDKKIKYVSWLIVALFGVVSLFGTYIWQTTMANINQTQLQVKETQKDIKDFQSVFLEYVRTNK